MLKQQPIEISLLNTGSLVPFRIINEAILAGPDDAEFGLEIELIMEDSEDDLEPTEIASWGAFGFIFIIAALSFNDARARGNSYADFVENDQFQIPDLFDGITYDAGELRYYGDYIRGRRVKTNITIRPDGTVKLQTIGRGKSANQWLAKLQGKKMMQIVN